MSQTNLKVHFQYSSVNKQIFAGRTFLILQCHLRLVSKLKLCVFVDNMKVKYLSVNFNLYSVVLFYLRGSAKVSQLYWQQTKCFELFLLFVHFSYFKIHLSDQYLKMVIHVQRSRINCTTRSSSLQKFIKKKFA